MVNLINKVIENVENDKEKKFEFKLKELLFLCVNLNIFF